MVGVVWLRVVLPVAFPLKDCSSEFVVMEVGMGPRSASAESAAEKARSKWVSDFDDRIVPVCDAAAASAERVLEKKRSKLDFAEFDEAAASAERASEKKRSKWDRLAGRAAQKLPYLPDLSQ